MNKITELVFTEEVFGEDSVTADTQSKCHKILARRGRKEFRNFFNCRNYSNTTILRVLDYATPDQILENPFFMKWILRYFQSIKKLGVTKIDCIWFTGILNNLPFDSQENAFTWSAIAEWDEIVIQDLTAWDMILTNLKDKEYSYHMATYLWNDYFLFKAGFEGNIQLANTKKMQDWYPHDQVLKCKPSNEELPLFSDFLGAPSN